MNGARELMRSVGRKANELKDGLINQLPFVQRHSSYDIESGSDVLAECPKVTSQYDLRPEATIVDGLMYNEVGNMLEKLNMKTKSPEEDIQRLKQRLFSGPRIQSFSQEIKDRLNKTVQMYKGLMKNPLEHYSELIATVENESFKKNMSEVAEMKFPRYEEKLQYIRTMLQKMTDEFEIGVFGDTSSGKSRFLNVLLGENILPSHTLHTTTCLCRLRNSDNKRIECIAGNGIVDNILLLTDSSELSRNLTSIMKELQSNEGEVKSLKTVDIYWPISALHENVVLVDTPGIGENHLLTNEVVRHVPNSAGYIFIIDSSHAGGVQDSGVRTLIEAIAESASKVVDTMDLSNTIFVCNKWDQVKEIDRDEVLKDTQRN